MNNYAKTEKTLLEKLQKVEEGEEVSLTPEEALRYRVEVLDVLPDEDLETDKELTLTKCAHGTKKDV